MTDATNTLIGMARFEGPEQEVAVRLAGHGDRLYLDLGNAEQQAVNFARSVERVVLVDGERLANLMIEHEVGVTLRALKVPKLDSDYFE